MVLGYNNNINIIEVETKQEYAKFDGVQLKNRDSILDYPSISNCYHISLVEWGYSRTHVKEIPNKRLFVSLHHSRKCANLKIFDISHKMQKKIFAAEEVTGSKN